MNNCTTCGTEVPDRYLCPPCRQDYDWQRRYGITREQYNELLVKQNDVCAVCGTDDPGRGHRYFSVDHDHSTGEVRGLLCNNCNVGIGMLLRDARDNAELLERLAYYLRHWPAKEVLMNDEDEFGGGT